MKLADGDAALGPDQRAGEGSYTEDADDRRESQDHHPGGSQPQVA